MIDGLEILESDFGQRQTVERLLATLDAGGMSVFAHIDHAAAAAQAGLELRPTDLFLVGTPEGGTPLMLAGQTIGIDLPLHILIWTDRQGWTHIAFNDPRWLVRRHELGSAIHERASLLYDRLGKIVAQTGSPD